MDIERQHKDIFIVRGFEVPEKGEKCLVNSRVILGIFSEKKDL